MESSPPAESVSISDSNDNASTSASEFEYCSLNTDQTSVDDTIPSNKPKLQPASNLEAISVTPTAAYTQFDPPLFTDENTTQKDYGEPGYDPFHKVRPVLQQFKKNCFMQYKPIRSNSISEVEIGLKKRILKSEKFIQNEHPKRGYKIWCHCDAENGYLCDFSVHS